MKRVGVGMLSLLLLLVCSVPMSAASSDAVQVDEAVLDQYLLDQGAPADWVNRLNIDLKKLYYNEKAKFILNFESAIL